MLCLHENAPALTHFLLPATKSNHKPRKKFDLDLMTLDLGLLTPSSAFSTIFKHSLSHQGHKRNRSSVRTEMDGQTWGLWKLKPVTDEMIQERNELEFPAKAIFSIKKTIFLNLHFDFFSFFPPRVIGSSCVKPYLKVYRRANPLACASALCVLAPKKSKKQLLIHEKLTFLTKNQKSQKST